MRRYLFGGSLRDAGRVDVDVVIAGCGAAGLYAALNLDPRLACVLLNKSGVKNSNSMYAQGGIAAVPRDASHDSPELHLADTLTAGAGLCDEDAVRVMVNEAWDDIGQLLQFHVPFDRKDGELLFTREGGHSRNRILHCDGDATGMQLTRSLYRAALGRDNVRMYDGMFLSDILTDDYGAAGVLAVDAQGVPCVYSAPVVIIASGGIGRVYRNSTSAKGATGDGIAAAARAGAPLKDMEFVQFHPTALTHPGENGRFFLISEALRGEGAILKNRRGEPFMQGVHPLADLAPRDIVSRAIISEMKKYDIPSVYLDITSKPRKFLRNRFPTIYAGCAERGIDIASDWIPVIPVQHYFMGGIKTDLDGRTGIPGLYACGEAACTGVHGANRLASNSLLECLVFGRRCARHINGLRRPGRWAADVLRPQAVARDESVDFDSFSWEIRGLMTRNCGIIRSRDGLAEAYGRISGIFGQLDGTYLGDGTEMEAYNRSQIAMAVLEAAIRREKSVGAHFRSDDAPGGQ